MMRMKFREVVWLDEFKRDFKSLSKRHATLEDDLAVFIGTSACAFHKLKLDTGIVRVEGLGHTRLPIYKARKFACRALKGRGARTGIRVIYAFDVDHDRGMAGWGHSRRIEEHLIRKPVIKTSRPSLNKGSRAGKALFRGTVYTVLVLGNNVLINTKLVIDLDRANILIC